MLNVHLRLGRLGVPQPKKLIPKNSGRLSNRDVHTTPNASMPIIANITQDIKDQIKQWFTEQDLTYTLEAAKNYFQGKDEIEEDWRTHYIWDQVSPWKIEVSLKVEKYPCGCWESPCEGKCASPPSNGFSHDGYIYNLNVYISYLDCRNDEPEYYPILEDGLQDGPLRYDMLDADFKTELLDDIDDSIKVGIMFFCGRKHDKHYCQYKLNHLDEVCAWVETEQWMEKRRKESALAAEFRPKLVDIFSTHGMIVDDDDNREGLEQLYDVITDLNSELVLQQEEWSPKVFQKGLIKLCSEREFKPQYTGLSENQLKLAGLTGNELKLARDENLAFSQLWISITRLHVEMRVNNWSRIVTV